MRIVVAGPVVAITRVGFPDAMCAEFAALHAAVRSAPALALVGFSRLAMAVPAFASVTVTAAWLVVTLCHGWSLTQKLPLMLQIVPPVRRLQAESRALFPDTGSSA